MPKPWILTIEYPPTGVKFTTQLAEEDAANIAQGARMPWPAASSSSSFGPLKIGLWPASGD